MIDGEVQLDGFRTAVERIAATRPDMVYYPSIGMDPNIIALVNLRLAPIQIISLGHPATSNTDTIDSANPGITALSTLHDQNANWFPTGMERKFLEVGK